MKKLSEARDYLTIMYAATGNNPAEITDVRFDRQGPDTNTYEVTRSDGKRAFVLRPYVDDQSDHLVKKALRNFS